MDSLLPLGSLAADVVQKIFLLSFMTPADVDSQSKTIHTVFLLNILSTSAGEEKEEKKR